MTSGLMTMALARDNFKSLELDHILRQVAKETSFSLAFDHILSLKVDFNPLMIKDEVNKTSEAIKVLSVEPRFDFSVINDLNEPLSNLKKGYTLLSGELLDILDHNLQIKRIKRHFKAVSNIDTLADYLDSLYYDEHLIEIIAKRIGDDGKVKDDASAKLYALRQELDELLKVIDQKAREFIKDHASSLQESVIYNRSERVCFLIKNADKNKFDGYNYGNSASNLASYIEPKPFIDLNNRKLSLENDIKEEINVILLYLSKEVLKDADYFLANLNSLMFLDSVFAKASYGLKNGGTMAKIDDHLSLENISHPLLEKDKAVKNTYRIIEPIRGIVISGSNTGGKTVSMKVIGLSVLMTYLGIPLLASKASVPLYDGVYSDIDDAQSIVDSLSTFSSRLVSLNNILNNATSRSLILIDEIASGTDPKEGEALALAILKRLVDLGADFVITTHFDKIKKYALSDEHILPASQEFDYQKLLPTYRYVEDSLGQSNALDIADRYLEDESLIKEAKAILKENTDEEARLLKSLEIENARLLKKEEELKEVLARQKDLKEDYEKKLVAFESKKEELYKEVKHKLDNYLEKKKAKARALFKNIDENKLKNHEVTELIAKLDTYKMKDVKKSEDVKLEEGDLVKIISYDQIGRLLSIKGDNATVDLNGLTLKTTLDDLAFYQKKAIKQTLKEHHKRNFKRPERELVLVGMRVEEALDVLGKYLDDCYGANMKSVKIVTGIGTGALRKAVWDHLKRNKNIKDYHLADYYDGGSAATIVEFK